MSKRQRYIHNRSETVQATMNQGRPPMAKLLSNRYGDGLIYLPKASQTGALSDAIKAGFVSEDGYLTRKGRNFLAQNQIQDLRG